MKDGIKGFGLSRLERGFCSFFYDNPKHYGTHAMVLESGAAIGSARAARVELNRRTVLNKITVKDWNLEVLTGATCTANGATQVYGLTIGKSLAGTGAFSIIGSAYVGSAGAADDTVIDCTCTETNFAAGDDIVFAAEVGTALGDNSLVARAHISYVETFVA